MALQRYVSDDLTHFLGRGQTELQQFDLLLHVLKTGVLAQPSYNVALSPTLTSDYSGSICDDKMFSPQVVCFCDIPVADLAIHMKKYSRFGIAFDKSFLVPQGATPVFYVAKNSSVPRDDERCTYFDRMLVRFHELMSGLNERARDPEDIRRISDVQRFLEFGVFSFIKFFDDTYPEDHPENYYMEREWRLLGAAKFELADVSRVIMPGRYARRFRSEVSDYFGQVIFV